MSADSLHTCAEFTARLLQASHVLLNNCSIIRNIASELQGRNALKSQCSVAESVTTAHVLSETARELEFHRAQVQLIHAQLDAAVLTVSFNNRYAFGNVLLIGNRSEILSACATRTQQRT